MLTVFASALGPLVLASTLERAGSYDVIFRGLGAMVVVLGLGCWFVAVPERPRRFEMLQAISPDRSA